MKRGVESQDANQTSRTGAISNKKAEQDEKVSAWVRQRGDLNRRGHNPRDWEHDDAEGH